MNKSPIRNHTENLADFSAARLGLFVHFGLYSLIGRGEWVLNREQIPIAEYRDWAKRFQPCHFDAEQIAGLARQAGCRYVCFTTMHHDGFALYDSAVNPFNSVRACGRDLVAEVVSACRRHGLRVHLYHSLNHWTCKPDGVAALEDRSAQQRFVEFAHERIRELVTRFNPIECLWYDGWWPFNAEGWQAEKMNAMVRSIQPHILFNGRNGLAGDFATPEQHLTAPRPWRPWEACITHNGNWGFHTGDQQWKPAWQIIEMLGTVAAGGGNLLLNIGPDGSGRIPDQSRHMLEALGGWMARNAEAIYGSEALPINLQRRQPGDRGDWTAHGPITARDKTFYFMLLKWPSRLVVTGIETGKAQSARLLGGNTLRIRQEAGRLTVDGLPEQPPDELGGVVAVDFDVKPVLYRTGGMRTPRVDHPRYDPIPSDLANHP